MHRLLSHKNRRIIIKNIFFEKEDKEYIATFMKLYRVFILAKKRRIPIKK